MMMMMHSLHFTHFPLSLPSSADNGRSADVVNIVITWTVLTAVWSESYWVSQQQKISHNNNTIQYLRILPSTQ